MTKRKELLKRIKMLQKNADVNRENYNTKGITNEQYHVRKKDVNNRITEIRREINELQ